MILAINIVSPESSSSKVNSPSGYTGALSVGYAHDVNGKVVRVTYPSGDVAAYTRTTDGLITAITFTPVGGAAQTIIAGATYEPFGPLASFTYGNGLTLSRGYDQDYRLTGINVAAPGGATRIALTFGWQPDGRLAGWNDAVGDRSVASATPGAALMTVSATSNQVTGTTLGGAPQRSRTYAAGGDLLTDAYVGGISYAYSYNAAKRLIGVTQNGAAAGAYAYDFRGQRVWRQTFGTGGTQTAYVYDKDGHLIAEHNAATGTVSREYVWLDDMPVALADISAGVATIGYIHTGQIDEPLEVTNQTQAIAWNAAADPFGAATIASGATTSVDIRLPGQSFQLEAGSLSQNHWRDYDPSLGRYAEADPLGLTAGPNVYGYVDGDPLNNSDPLGLQAVNPLEATCVDPAQPACWAGLALGTLGVYEAGQAANALSNSQSKSKAGFCPPPNDDCKKLIADIYQAMEQVENRAAAMANDDESIFTRAFSTPMTSAPRLGTWMGHATQLSGWRTRLNNLINQADAKGCPVPHGAREAANLGTPLNPMGRF